MFKSLFSPSKTLIYRINKVAQILANSKNYQPPELFAHAICGVACWMVSKGKWKHTTAASKLASLEKWVERRLPGTTKVPVWAIARRYLSTQTHEVKRAPILTPERMMEISRKLRPGARSVFWLTCLTAARAGNLHGIRVNKISPEGVTYTWSAHKTVSSAGQRTLHLPFWHETMRSSIMKQLDVGPVPKEWITCMKKGLKAMKVQLHSMRRTSVQHYIESGLTFEELKTITLHKSDQMLLRYVSHYEPTRRVFSSKKQEEGGTPASLRQTTNQRIGNVTTMKLARKAPKASAKPQPRDASGRFTRQK